MEVLINNRQKKVKLGLARLRKIAAEILKFEGSPENAELSLVLCDDDFIQKLNNDHLGRNQPTDVLSFPIEEEDFEPEVRLLGDVVISVETACRQAEKLKHPPMLEVVFLLIHGLLHLHGYDHHRRADLMRMKEREETIFRHLCDTKLLTRGDVQAPPSLIKRVL